ncbi:MAG TPA: hypothetical protein DCQ26_10230 [Marinilabiliales bacterium]|nr:MAG: hypothetical protein A2W95_13925 [Bacteroidetes bacterium GWA2_40_14]OFX63579.1 MAG: hypothetical protein A2W84_08595 [Bacteroidetes bacterium GWC2_40_13]OFX73275.1 MAG: hypothetical protein A2W96_07385 [Bacteroidetes bacterium GWD2_40_43]OFX92130.1 MAG: hypothetical protein A2W97_08675 [Bacteroidetes bacterium GWE2_40_63]OFY24300.1 MAG: hypothetical protein A2W88_07535 [Bacteroidetes bacterium GWF2_40_13]OFZ28919.1 MAG: hypothetical protein A2437_02635 [Bacteroidetes bacterium RIFOXYC
MLSFIFSFKMQRYLKKITLFMLMLPVFLATFTVLWGLFTPSFIKDNLNYKLGSDSFLYNRIREAKQVQNVDVLVLGASQAYRGFDPRIFEEQGIRLFNLGSSNQTQIQTEVLIKTYLERLHPKVILFVVNPESFSMDGVESSIDFLCNGVIDNQVTAMVFRLNSIKTYFTFVYAGFRQLMGMDNDFVHPIQMEHDEYISGGFVEKEYQPYRDVLPNDSVRWIPRHFQMEAFERNIETLKKSKSCIIFVQAPVLREFDSKIMNAEWYNQYFASFNVPYYNYTQILNLPKSFFYDNFHLNQHGVDTFNNDLVERLALKQKITEVTMTYYH